MLFSTTSLPSSMRVAKVAQFSFYLCHMAGMFLYPRRICQAWFHVAEMLLKKDNVAQWRSQSRGLVAPPPPSLPSSPRQFAHRVNLHRAFCCFWLEPWRVPVHLCVFLLIIRFAFKRVKRNQEKREDTHLKKKLAFPRRSAINCSMRKLKHNILHHHREKKRKKIPIFCDGPPLLQEFCILFFRANHGQ